MGDKGSSSRRTHSKKKISKLSSKALKKKKKNRRNVSNKHIVSKHNSSSTSEAEHRNRRTKSKRPKRPRSVSSSSYDCSSTSDSSPTLLMCKTSSKSRKKGYLKKDDRSPDYTGSRKRKRSTQGHVKSRKKSHKHSNKSESESFSTGSGRSNSSISPGYHQKSEEANKEKERSRGRRSKRDDGKSKIRSQSSSSCSERDLDAANNSRRLKSVIAFSNHHLDEIDNRWEMDSHKEEMVCDRDDYPSPKSLDSNEGGSKREPENQSYGERKKRIRVEDVEFEESSEPLKYDSHCQDRYCGSDSQSIEVPLKVPEETKTSSADKSKNGDGNHDLESILRLKALENLKRYRGGLPESLTGIAESIQNKPTEQTSFNKPEAVKDSFQLTETVNPDGISRQKVSPFPSDLSIKDEVTNTPTVTVKPSNSNQGARSTNPSTEQISQALPTLGDASLKALPSEVGDGSGFEQKTMSVMRGGEMVQVSYKVYIPKKTPALARRQLRR